MHSLPAFLIFFCFRKFSPPGNYYGVQRFWWHGHYVFLVPSYSPYLKLIMLPTTPVLLATDFRAPLDATTPVTIVAGT
jgi:hypothetical protein